MRATDKLRQDAADGLKTITPPGLRKWLVHSRLRVRIATSPLRLLPDMLVIGGQRCGTSSLYKYLGRHPNVAPSLRKEIEYFSVDYTHGERWYRAHFPLRARRGLAGATGRPLLTFEATPDYLFDPRAPGRVNSLIPDAKLIVMLREPAERAISHYHHNRRLGHEPLDLEDALRAEDDRVAGGLERAIADPTDRAVELRRFSYVGRGRYAEQLERWFAHFPAEQILAIRSEDLFGAPAATFDRILTFLGLPIWYPPEFRNYSYVNAIDGDYPTPPDSAMEYLAARFLEPNARLVDLLGEEYRWDAPATR